MSTATQLGSWVSEQGAHSGAVALWAGGSKCHVNLVQLRLSGLFTHLL